VSAEHPLEVAARCVPQSEPAILPGADQRGAVRGESDRGHGAGLLGQLAVASEIPEPEAEIVARGCEIATLRRELESTNSRMVPSQYARWRVAREIPQMHRSRGAGVGQRPTVGRFVRPSRTPTRAVRRRGR
jgi:hypothetical protein